MIHDKKAEAVHLGLLARDLIENETLKAAFVAIREELREASIKHPGSRPDDVTEREDLRRCVLMLDRVWAKLETWQGNGKIAQRDIENLT